MPHGIALYDMDAGDDDELEFRYVGLFLVSGSFVCTRFLMMKFSSGGRGCLLRLRASSISIFYIGAHGYEAGAEHVHGPDVCAAGRIVRVM